MPHSCDALLHSRLPGLVRGLCSGAAAGVMATLMCTATLAQAQVFPGNMSGGMGASSAGPGVTHPPIIRTQLDSRRDADFHPQSAIAPTQRVHTQMRLEFFQKLFEPSSTGSLSQSQQAKVAQLEKALYGKQYAKHSMGKRLSRLEASVLGAQYAEGRSQMLVQERLNTLVAAIKANPDVLVRIDDAANDGQQAVAAQYSETDDDVSLGYMEERLYRVRHDEDDEAIRLSRLETTLYGKPQPQWPRKQRMARLMERFPLSARGVHLRSQSDPVGIVIAPIQQENRLTPPADMGGPDVMTYPSRVQADFSNPGILRSPSVMEFPAESASTTTLTPRHPSSLPATRPVASGPVPVVVPASNVPSAPVNVVFTPLPAPVATQQPQAESVQPVNDDTAVAMPVKAALPSSPAQRLQHYRNQSALGTASVKEASAAVVVPGMVPLPGRSGHLFTRPANMPSVHVQPAVPSMPVLPVVNRNP